MIIDSMASVHLPRVAELERLCFSTPWSLASLQQELRSPISTWLVAQIDGTTAGYAGMHRVLDEAYVANVAVDPAFRRQGIARALMLALVDFCRREGDAFITLEVRLSNGGAIRLYQGLGFEETGRRKDYYTHPTEDALLMTKFFKREDPK